LNVLTKLSATPLLCGLHTGVFTGVRPSDLAMRLVS
jgi:hypothetical protein